MIFYRIFELMLPTLIQKYDKKIISFFIHFKNERLSEILQAVRCHMIVLLIINTIYQFIKLFLDKKNNVYFRGI